MGYLYKRGRIWWMKYYRNGHPIRESTGTDKETEAKRFLKEREGAVATGRPILPRADKVLFEELAQDLLYDYRVNGKRSIENAERNVSHLAEAFTGRRVVNITTTDIRAYIERRQQAGASNATINRELAALKRMFNLAIQAEKIYRKPHIPSLEENNIRTGFFSEVDFLALHEALPEAADHTPPGMDFGPCHFCGARCCRSRGAHCLGTGRGPTKVLLSRRGIHPSLASLL